MKKFEIHNKVLLSILPFFMVIALIGSGFALFVFNNEEQNESANITIKVENGYELGNVYLTSSDATFDDSSDVSIPNNIESNDTSLSTTLFFDYKSLYFIRSDNITKERDFNIYYYNTSSESDDFSYDNLQLNLDIEISSSVAKDSIDSSTYSYAYSTSAIDYIDLDSSEAGIVTTDIEGNESNNKTTPSIAASYSNQNKTASATYTLQTGLISNSNYLVNLDLAYNSILAPNAESNSNYFSDVISKMKAAITSSNTSITLTFYLTYNE